MRIEKEKLLYKDDPALNHRNKAEYDKNLKYLADLVRNAKKYPDGNPMLLEKLINDSEIIKETNPTHDICDAPETVRLTEKRICRCMYYYGKKKELCDKCKLKKKWNNVGKLKITDYEVPMEYVVSRVGGVDLLIEDKYAAEIKPEGSSETLVRMIAEILTYTAIDRGYKPAICFFENSKQMKDFKAYREENNRDLKYLMQYISVFYISYTEREDESSIVCDYKIEQIEE